MEHAFGVIDAGNAAVAADVMLTDADTSADGCDHDVAGQHGSNRVDFVPLGVADLAVAADETEVDGFAAGVDRQLQTPSCAHQPHEVSAHPACH